MILKIIKYGEPILEQRAEPVTDFATPELQQLVDNMFETMYAAKGVGLAAPQVGVSQRVSVIDVSVGEDPDQKVVLINPEVTFPDGKPMEWDGEELLARAFLHEIDHLNGILFLNHLSGLKRDIIRRKIKKLQKNGEWE